MITSATCCCTARRRVGPGPARSGARRSAASARCTAVAIADGKLSMRALKGTVFGVEGDDVGRATASKLSPRSTASCSRSTARRWRRTTPRRRWRRTTVVALLDAAAAVLATVGVPQDRAAQALVPLAEGALRNIAAHGTTVG